MDATSILDSTFNAEGFDGLIMWAAGLTGPKAHPGSYFVKLNLANLNTQQTE